MATTRAESIGSAAISFDSRSIEQSGSSSIRCTRNAISAWVGNTRSPRAASAAMVSRAFWMTMAVRSGPCVAPAREAGRRSEEFDVVALVAQVGDEALQHLAHRHAGERGLEHLALLGRGVLGADRLLQLHPLVAAQRAIGVGDEVRQVGEAVADVRQALREPVVELEGDDRLLRRAVDLAGIGQ